MRILIVKKEDHSVFGYSLPFTCVGRARFGEEGDLVTERLLRAPACDKRQLAARELFHQMVERNAKDMQKSVHTSYVNRSTLVTSAGVVMSWSTDHTRRETRRKAVV